MSDSTRQTVVDFVLQDRKPILAAMLLAAALALTLVVLASTLHDIGHRLLAGVVPGVGMQRSGQTTVRRASQGDTIVRDEVLSEDLAVMDAVGDSPDGVTGKRHAHYLLVGFDGGILPLSDEEIALSGRS